MAAKTLTTFLRLLSPTTQVETLAVAESAAWETVVNPPVEGWPSGFT
jgi:hypothetical protein